MSGPIRSILGPTRKRLQDQLNEADALPALTLSPDLAKTDKLNTVIQAIYNLKSIVNRIYKSVQILESKNSEWCSHIQSLSREEQEHEQNLYQQFVDDTHFVDVMLAGEDKLAELNVKLDEYEFTKQSIEEPSTTSRPPSPSVYSESSMGSRPVSQLNQQRRRNTNDQGARNTLRVKLPELKLVEFDGEDDTKFKLFWDSFDSGIHSQNLDNYSKFSYLMGVLKGKALSVVEGLPKTSDNYDIAVQMLREKYTNTRAIKQKLLNDLSKIPKCSRRVDSLTQTFDSVERVLRQLTAVGENIDQSALVSNVLHKFPFDIVAKIEEKKGSKDEWKMSELREHLKDVIDVKKRALQSSGVDELSKPENNEKTKTNKWFNQSNQSNVSNSFRSNQNKSNNSGPKGSGVSGTLFNQSKPKSESFKSSKAPYPCLMCNGDHYPDNCTEFMTFESRQEIISKLKLCFLCLKSNHMAYNCPVKQRLKKCFHCGSNKHNKVFCKVHIQQLAKQNGSSSNSNPNNKINQVNNKNKNLQSSDRKNPLSQDTQFMGMVTGPPSYEEQSESNVSKEENDTKPQLSAVSTPIEKKEKCMLLTATVQVFNPDQRLKPVSVRILLDSGSQKTFIKKSVTKLLKLKTEQHQVLSVLCFGSEKPIQVPSEVVTFSVILHNGEEAQITAHSIDLLTGKLRREALDQCDIDCLHKYPENCFADPLPEEAEDFCPDIILGLNHFLSLVNTGALKPLPSGLMMIPSAFGMLIGGSIDADLAIEETFGPSNRTGSVQFDTTAVNVMSPVMSLFLQPDAAIKPKISLEDFWTIESLGIRDDPNVSENDIALQKFHENFEFKDGRYVMSWLWKSDKPILPANREVALAKFRSTIKRLVNNEHLLQSCQELINFQKENCIIEEVIDESKIAGPLHYISFLLVIKPDRLSTKIRIVYHCSFKEHPELHSFNDCLTTGPIIMPDLCGILIRFRLNHIAIVGDITKAFLQLGLHEQDRDCCRFFWIKDPKHKPLLDPQNVTVYRFTRVLFGAKSSPAMLNLTIDFHLRLFQKHYCRTN